MIRRLGIALGVATAMASMAFAQGVPAPWITAVKPFAIADNLYYVGTQGLSAYLIDTGDGLVLIDGTLEQNVPAIEAGIKALGFKPGEIKLLLNSHAHFDHSAGLAKLKSLTGATLAASERDAPWLENGRYPGIDMPAFHAPPVKVDRRLKDGEIVRLGGVALTANLTPGHTPGCTSWTFAVAVKGRPKTVIIHCSSSVAANRLAPVEQYPGVVADYRRTFARLAGLKADIFLAPHPEQFGLAAKRRKLEAGDAFAFVDPSELARRNEASRSAFETELKRQREAAG
ncbi:MAG: subclass B3 metallo-beta-lactamase [Pseudomonadota bacterium]